MNAIERTLSTTQVLPVLGPRKVAAAPTVSAGLTTRGADDASSLMSASSLRVRLSGPHADSMRLSETAMAVDVADEALWGVEGLLKSARGVIGDPGGVIDPILASIDGMTGQARAGGLAILHDGITLKAGETMLDVRPMSINDLGAVIEMGRSHRLVDLRAGGALDARVFPDAARRSADAALSEVAAVRMQLRDFGASAIRPAMRAGLAKFSSIVGLGPVTGVGDDASAIRGGLLGDTHTARGAVSGLSPEGVLGLLG